MLKPVRFIFWIVMCLVCFGSCVQEPNFSTTPVIKFNSIRKIVKTSNDGLGSKIKIDSVIMSVDFQDGDGDLGLTVAQLKANPKYKDFSNFIVDVLIQKNGKFVPINFSPRLGGLVNFPFLPNQKPGPIEGRVDYSTPFVYAFWKGYSPLFTEKNDTLKFQIKIVDNAFHVSNTIETDPIIIFQD
jgi:hypothetical protein